MELHTLGVDGGYTQDDVINVAKVLTGWTISTRGIVNAREEDGVFMFDPLLHVDGDKTVLGQQIPSGGIDEGERLIKMLATHPSTARLLATKLARRFIADAPPPAVVEAASRRFLDTGGDIRETLRTILMSAQFRSPEFQQVKIKKPFELVTSALRAVNADIEPPQAGDFVGGNQSVITQMGEKMYNYEAPDGNPDVGAAYMNSNALLVRLEFANNLAANRYRGVTFNSSTAQAALERFGLPKPTPTQIEQTRKMMRPAFPEGSAAGGMYQMSQMTQMAGGPASGAPPAPLLEPAAIAVAAMLGSPQFQKR